MKEEGPPKKGLATERGDRVRSPNSPIRDDLENKITKEGELDAGKSRRKGGDQFATKAIIGKGGFVGEKRASAASRRGEPLICHKKITTLTVRGESSLRPLGGKGRRVIGVSALWGERSLFLPKSLIMELRM